MIKNKQESIDFIVKNQLNTTITSKIFIKDNIDYEYLWNFLLATDFEYYGIREAKSSGLFSYAVRMDKITETITKEYKDKNFSLCESMYYHDRYNMLIQGDFYITKDFIIGGGYSDIKGKSLRESCLNFPYKFWNIDLKENREAKKLSKNIQYIFDYLIKNNIFDKIVELTLYNFDTRVGFKEENIIVWEVRNY